MSSRSLSSRAAARRRAAGRAARGRRAGPAGRPGRGSRQRAPRPRRTAPRRARGRRSRPRRRERDQPVDEVERLAPEPAQEDALLERGERLVRAAVRGERDAVARCGPRRPRPRRAGRARARGRPPRRARRICSPRSPAHPGDQRQVGDRAATPDDPLLGGRGERGRLAQPALRRVEVAVAVVRPAERPGDHGPPRRVGRPRARAERAPCSRIAAHVAPAERRAEHRQARRERDEAVGQRPSSSPPSARTWPAAARMSSSRPRSAATHA